MTLVAAYRIGRVPAVLSDTLVSGGPGEHAPISTRVDLGKPLPAYWQTAVKGLSRKSVLIGENVAAAVAGNGFGAAVVCQKLQERFRGLRPEAATLAAGLSEMNDAMSEQTAFTLVGWVVGKDGPRSFRWRSSAPKDIDWDHDFIEGSGADLFQEIAWSPTQRDWQLIDNFDHAQYYGLIQLSSLFVNEMTNGIPIFNLFGGGYDLLLWDGMRFRQGGDVTFLFLPIDWLQSVTGGADEAAPLLIRQAEVEDCLIVRTLLPPNQLGAEPHKVERIAVIAPITSVGSHHRLEAAHDLSEFSHFAERIFVVIVGRAPSGAMEHWAGGVSGEEAAGFKLETNSFTGRTRFYLPSGVMDRMMGAAALQFAEDDKPNR